jgi:hypothetical protein
MSFSHASIGGHPHDAYRLAISNPGRSSTPYEEDCESNLDSQPSLPATNGLLYSREEKY